MSLKREIGLFPATNIVVANMIGAGIFTTSGLILADIGNPAIMMMLWIIGGLLALSGAVIYGELGISMPECGGEYHFLSRIYHPSIGFTAGWISIVAGFSAPVAASSLGFTEYLLHAFPSLQHICIEKLHISQVALSKTISVALVLMLTLIHLKGIRFGTRVQNYLTLMKVGVLAIIIILGFLSGRGSLDNINFAFETEGVWPWAKSAGLSLMWIMFAYSGWNAATYIGGEIRDPRKNLPKSLIYGTIVVAVIYILLNLLFIYAIPQADMAGEIAVGGLALGRLYGPTAGLITSLVIAVALFSSISAYIIIGPRVTYAMARDGLFFKGFSKLNNSNFSPDRAILLQCSLACLFIISGTFDQVLTYLGFSLGLFSLLTVIGAMRLRLRKQLTVTLTKTLVPHLFFIILNLAVLILAFSQRPVESMAAVAGVLSGLPLYAIFRRKTLN